MHPYFKINNNFLSNIFSDEPTKLSEYEAHDLSMTVQLVKNAWQSIVKIMYWGVNRKENVRKIQISQIYTTACHNKGVKQTARTNQQKCLTSTKDQWNRGANFTVSIGNGNNERVSQDWLKRHYSNHLWKNYPNLMHVSQIVSHQITTMFA